MEENYIKHATGIIQVNGGNPLEGSDCPTDWDQAKKIQEELNAGKEIDPDFGPDQPAWKFDCGFKLDFDGPLLSVSSRFYPPKDGYGSGWDGRVCIMCYGKDISEKKFDCPTLEELRKQVEEYVASIREKLLNALK